MKSQSPFNDKPLISYVITTYNNERFARQAIECAFAQTYQPLEIVISDDCSEDNTFTIMQQMVYQYTGPHKIVLNRNNKNLGIVQHMNKVYLQLASGEIIIAAHGDDISIPERTEISYYYLNGHPQCTAMSMSMKSIDEDGHLNGTDDVVVSREMIYTLNDDAKHVANIPAPSRAFYKKVMIEFGPLNERCRTEDELISFRALLMGNNALIPQVGVYHRKNSASASNFSNSKRFPLESTVEQQFIDLGKAIEKQLITYSVGEMSKSFSNYSKAVNPPPVTPQISCDTWMAIIAAHPVLNTLRYPDKNVTFIQPSPSMLFSNRLKSYCQACCRRVRNIIDRCRLTNKDVSIISNHCMGGIMSHDLGLIFKSPTVNLKILPDDFIEFVEDLPHSLGATIKQVYEKGINYPIGELKTATGRPVRIYFVHYNSFEQALLKWQQRAKRVNLNNMAVLMTTRDDCMASTLERFEQLPFKQKICFTRLNHPKFKSTHRARLDSGKELKGYISDIIRWDGKRAYQCNGFDYVGFLNQAKP